MPVKQAEEEEVVVEEEWEELLALFKLLWLVIVVKLMLLSAAALLASLTVVVPLCSLTIGVAFDAATAFGVLMTLAALDVTVVRAIWTCGRV